MRKECRISFRLSEEEYTKVKNKADQFDMKISEYVRNLIDLAISRQYTHPVLRQDRKEKRDRVCVFRMNYGEQRRLKELSSISGLSEASILRTRIAMTSVPKPLSVDDKWILTELKRIGNNLNQIAAVGNATKTVDELYLRENIADLSDALEQIRRVYGLR